MIVGKRVAIIGAGVSGLVSIKTCLEDGFQPTCFERGQQIGGVWIYSDGDTRGGASAMYNGLVTNPSKQMMCLSDFPYPSEHPPYLSVHHVIEYYRDYVSHHDLEKYINFDTEVTDVSPADDTQPGQWIVTTKQGDREKTDVFDAVMVCTGCHSKKRMPHNLGIDEFKGHVMHSNRFRRGEDFADQNVLVIGTSHSAGDVAAQCSYHAKATYMSFRKDCNVVGRRGPNGMPIDTLMNRRLLSMLPQFIQSRIMQRLVESRINVDNSSLLSGKEDILGGSFMLNDSLPDRIFNGTLKVKAHIERFSENGVKFVDGTTLDNIDTVICATGYVTTYPFINRDILDETRLELYKHILSPRYTTLAFIGAVGSPGALGPIFELQARWATSVFAGKLKIPDLKTRQMDAKIRVDNMIQKFGYQKILLAPVPYQDDLASDIGVKPTLDLFLTDPRLAAMVFFGPAYPPSYRLKGRNTWEGARDAVMNGWTNTIKSTQPTHVTTQHSNSFLFIFGVMFTFILILAILP